MKAVARQLHVDRSREGGKFRHGVTSGSHACSLSSLSSLLVAEVLVRLVAVSCPCLCGPSRGGHHSPQPTNFTSTARRPGPYWGREAGGVVDSGYRWETGGEAGELRERGGCCYLLKEIQVQSFNENKTTVTAIHSQRYFCKKRYKTNFKIYSKAWVGVFSE